jgi:c-di-GMP-binding flagellar brake protein YcgR
MQSTLPNFGTENQSPYQVDSRREIIAILKGFKDKNQLISMMINQGSEIFITSVLEIDDINNAVIIDSSPSDEANKRIAESASVYFEGLLDRISIQFSSSRLIRTIYDKRPALQMSIPLNLIRLQRREFYRINTPITQPIRAKISTEIDGDPVQLHFPLVDISCGGIAILDEKRLLNVDMMQRYTQCQIDLPTVGIIDLTLEIRNSQDLTLLNGKTNRRIGCAFVNLSSRDLASVQRYIMKLERERNSAYSSGR